jgi:hypothetical protein
MSPGEAGLFGVSVKRRSRGNAVRAAARLGL